MAKCIVSGMGVGGGDGWKLLNDWHLVIPDTSDGISTTKYGKFNSGVLVDYDIVRCEVHGSVTVSENTLYPGQKCGEIYATSFFKEIYKFVGSGQQSVFPLDYIFQAHIGYDGSYGILYMDINNNLRVLPVLNCITITKDTEYGSRGMRSVDLHIKIFAKK